MSKSVRLKDHLVAEVERLASEERRSLAQMVEILLEQALKMSAHVVNADAQPRDIPTRSVTPQPQADERRRADQEWLMRRAGKKR